MTSAVAAVLPVYALAVLGWLLARNQVVTADFWSAVQKINYTVFIPVLLFHSIATATLTFGSSVATVAAVAITLASGAALFDQWRNQSDMAPAGVPAIAECALRANVPFGFALTLALVGTDGMGPFAIAATTYLPVVILIGGLTVSRVATDQAGKDAFPIPAFALILKNPIVIGAVAGLVWQLLDLPLPAGPSNTLKILAYAAMAMGVLAAGAAFDANKASAALREAQSTALAVTAIKLGALPVTAALLCLLFRADNAAALAAVTLAALPAVVPRFTVAGRDGPAAPLAAGMVALSMAGGVVTLPLILWILT